MKWNAAQEQQLVGLYSQGITGREAAARLGRSVDSVCNKAGRLGLRSSPRAAPPVMPIEKQARLEAARGQAKAAKADLKRALVKIAELEDVRDLIASACEPLTTGGSWKLPAKWKNKGEFPAVALVGDWQIGEVVQPSETDGAGAFDYSIAQRRVETYSLEFLKWLETMRSGLVVKSIRVPVLGDMVSGDIHDALTRTNEWPMPVAAVKAGELLARLVASLAPHAEAVEVEMVGLDNHGRLSKKLQWKEGAFNNWNHVVFHVAKERLLRHSNVRMHYSLSGITRRAWPGQDVLLMHGHQMRAWLGLPFYAMQRFRGQRAEQELDRALRAVAEDFKLAGLLPFREIIMGHWHVPARLPGIIVNGSLSGTTELDQNVGRYASPSQTSFLWHPKYGPFNLTEWVLEGR